MMPQSVRATCPGRGIATGAVVLMAQPCALQPSVVSLEPCTCLVILPLINIALAAIFTEGISSVCVFILHKQYIVLLAALLSTAGWWQLLCSNRNQSKMPSSSPCMCILVSLSKT